MAKKVQAYVKLQIPAGQANPSPPVGPALGQQGVNIMEFCKAFNASTQGLEQGMPASRPCVEALNALQNSMMFTPCWPSAGPTGGLGFACPAGICSFTYACTFFAISLGLLAGQRCAGSYP